MNFEKIGNILDSAAAEKRFVLYEHEVYEILENAVLKVPGHIFVKTVKGIGKKLKDNFLDKKQLVVKVVSDRIIHKTEAGGVAIGIEAEDIPETVEELAKKIPPTYAEWLRENKAKAPDFYRELLSNKKKLETQIAKDIKGFLIVEMIEYREVFGSECIIGAKFDKAFGPIVMFGPGGTRSEFYAGSFLPHLSVAITSAITRDKEYLEKLIKDLAITKALSGSLRGEKPLTGIKNIIDTIIAFQKIVDHFSFENRDAKWFIEDLEVNPYVCGKNNTLYPLDGMLRFSPAVPVPPTRNVKKVKDLLDPGKVGVIGISGTKITPAGTIVENLIQSGVSRNNISIVHPKEAEINGCLCYDSLDSFKKKIKKVDLFVVGVPAAGPKGRTAIDVVEYVVKNNLSGSVLIISAGFDETEHGRKGAEKLREYIADSRLKGKDTPVISGPNNLGNIYGRIDTRFTPSYKSSANGVGRKNVALICQSGAFMLTRLSGLAGVVNPATAISIGNQLDLTFSDYLEFLENQPGSSVFGVYIEGFRYGDGLKFCNIVKRMTSKGKKVIVYKAGKTPEGQDATQGHTASLAGDYAAAERLLKQSGAFVAESFREFQSMIKLSSLLEGSGIDPGVKMPRVAALSNAGFEKCAIGDNLYAGGRKIMDIADYTDKTKKLIHKIFEKYGLLSFIDIGDILDLTPIANDAVYKEIVETIMEDPNVDCGLISIVPETAMLQTLDSKKHKESFSGDTGIARYLADIRNNTNKPMIVSLESGKLYDPMASYLEMANIPTFRIVESAASILGKYMQFRITNKIWKY